MHCAIRRLSDPFGPQPAERLLRARSELPFGVILIRAATPAPLLCDQIGLCITLGVPVVCLFWDMGRAVVDRLRDVGITAVYQVGSVQDTQNAGAQAAMLCTALIGARQAFVHDFHKRRLVAASATPRTPPCRPRAAR